MIIKYNIFPIWCSTDYQIFYWVDSISTVSNISIEDEEISWRYYTWMKINPCTILNFFYYRKACILILNIRNIIVNQNAKESYEFHSDLSISYYELLLRSYLFIILCHIFIYDNVL